MIIRRLRCSKWRRRSVACARRLGDAGVGGGACGASLTATALVSRSQLARQARCTRLAARCMAITGSSHGLCTSRRRQR